jgi:hypothetical protein
LLLGINRPCHIVAGFFSGGHMQEYTTKRPSVPVPR